MAEQHIGDAESFYGLEIDAVPAFVGLGDQYVPFDELPSETQTYVRMLLEFLRTRHSENPLAFEAVIRFLAAAIDDAELPD